MLSSLPYKFALREFSNIGTLQTLDRIVRGSDRDLFDDIAS